MNRIVGIKLFVVGAVTMSFVTQVAQIRADSSAATQPVGVNAATTTRPAAVTTQPAGSSVSTTKRASSATSRPADPAVPSQTASGTLTRTTPSRVVATRPAPIESKQVGGEPDGIVQVANLVYAGTKSSRCFSDHFLVQAEKDSAISTSRRFHAVKLESNDLFDFPMVIMTGEGTFTLRDAERHHLRRYAENGGVLLASAGCSSEEWDTAFRNEMATIFADAALSPIGMDHPMFHTVYDITKLTAHHGTPRPLEGISLGGRLAVIYSRDGLNDTAHAQGCCCCGGNEITNAVSVNVNILAYAVMY